jgi:hypothetical protein
MLLRSLFLFALCLASATFAFPHETRAAVTLLKPPNNLGLVGYWSFNEGVGTIATDFSGNGNHGTLGGTPAPTWTSGKRGTALDLTSTVDQQDRVTVASTTVLQPLSITVAAWLKITDTVGNGHIVSYTGNLDRGYNLLTNSEGFGYGCAASSVSFWLYEGDDQCLSYAFANFTPGSWNHMTGTYDGETIRLYVNGTEVASSTSPSGPIQYESGTTFCIGNRSSSETVCNQSGTNYGGLVDEIRAYNRALSASEVAALYQSGAVRLNASAADLDDGSTLGSGLVGHWTFDGGDIVWASSTAGTATDRSGNGRNGTLTNMSQSSSPALGKLGQAFYFDGTNDYVNIGNVSFLDSATAASVCVWMKYNAASVTGDGAIVSEFGGAAGSWIFFVDDVAAISGRTDTINFSPNGSTGGGAGGRVEGSTGLVTPGAWDHYCGTFQGSTFIRLYKNGVLDQQNTTSVVSAIPSSSFNLRMGATDEGPARYLNATLDDVRVYNRALSAAEVQRLYKLGAARITQ